MVLESFGEVAVGGLLDQLRQRFHDLILGVINVLEAMQKQIFHGLDVLGEKAHRSILLKRVRRVPPTYQAAVGFILEPSPHANVARSRAPRTLKRSKPC